jgi:tRNA (cmo5U34)-methyltransferase
MPTDSQPARDIAEGFTPGGWEFTAEVAGVFGEHVRASVPFYDEIQDLIAETTDWLVPDGGLVADLGAATGITADRILTRQPATRHLRFTLYDEAAPMLAEAAVLLADRAEVTYHEQQIQGQLTHVGADLTLALFTLQFLPFPDRRTVLAAARRCSATHGALIVAEKIRPADTRWAEIATDVSHDWKAAHGLTDAAIRAKARALRGVLMPSTMTALTEAVTAAGWQTPEILFRWHQWVVLGAFATGDGMTGPLPVLPGFGGMHRPGSTP